MIVNKENEIKLAVHIDFEEVKHNLHIKEDETDDNEYISELIEAAIDEARDVCDHYFAHTELEYKFLENEGLDEYTFKLSPFNEIISIEGSDDDSIYTPISDFIIDKGETKFRIKFNETISYPYIKLKFRVGYPIGKLPSNVKRAIIVKSSNMFDIERSDYSMKTINNFTFRTLLGRYINERW